MIFIYILGAIAAFGNVLFSIYGVKESDTKRRRYIYIALCVLWLIAFAGQTSMLVLTACA